MKALVLILCLLPLGTIAQTLPEFAFQKLDGTDYFSENVPKDKPVLVYYFDPYCEVCATQADILMDEQLSHATILFVALDDSESVARFAHIHKLSAPNCVVAIDLMMIFDTAFGFTEFGTLFCYNAQHQLVETFAGPTAIDPILNALR